MNKQIQLFKPKYRIDECLNEIKECLEKGWTGLGFKTVEFENEWKKFTDLDNAHFLNSATVGLDLALNIFKEENNWDDNSEVITTALTFVSTNHVILYNNLKPVFADIDESLCLSPKSVESKITPQTKAIMFVGLGGNIGQYQEIVKIAQKHNLKLILDAAHMAGTRMPDGSVPGKDTADCIVYSFQAVKNLPTADSGMICFKKKKYDQIVRKKTWLGINKDTYSRDNEKGAYKWKYDVEYVGYKFHGNSIMAAMGLVSLRYLDMDNAYRRQLSGWYEKNLKNISGIKIIEHNSDCESSRHLFQIRVKNRDSLIMALNESGIAPGVHYIDNTNYDMYSYAKGTCPNAQKASDELLSLPLHLDVTKEDVDYICEKIKEYIQNQSA